MSSQGDTKPPDSSAAVSAVVAAQRLLPPPAAPPAASGASCTAVAPVDLPGAAGARVVVKSVQHTEQLSSHSTVGARPQHLQVGVAAGISSSPSSVISSTGALSSSTSHHQNHHAQHSSSGTSGGGTILAGVTTVYAQQQPQQQQQSSSSQSVTITATAPSHLIVPAAGKTASLRPPIRPLHSNSVTPVVSVAATATGPISKMVVAASAGGATAASSVNGGSAVSKTGTSIGTGTVSGSSVTPNMSTGSHHLQARTTSTLHLIQQHAGPGSMVSGSVVARRAIATSSSVMVATGPGNAGSAAASPLTSATGMVQGVPSGGVTTTSFIRPASAITSTTAQFSSHVPRGPATVASITAGPKTAVVATPIIRQTTGSASASSAVAAAAASTLHHQQHIQHATSSIGSGSGTGGGVNVVLTPTGAAASALAGSATRTSGNASVSVTPVGSASPGGTVAASLNPSARPFAPVTMVEVATKPGGGVPCTGSVLGTLPTGVAAVAVNPAVSAAAGGIAAHLGQAHSTGQTHQQATQLHVGVVQSSLTGSGAVTIEPAPSSGGRSAMVSSLTAGATGGVHKTVASHAQQQQTTVYAPTAIFQPVVSVATAAPPGTSVAAAGQQQPGTLAAGVDKVTTLPATATFFKTSCANAAGSGPTTGTVSFTRGATTFTPITTSQASQQQQQQAQHQTATSVTPVVTLGAAGGAPSVTITTNNPKLNVATPSAGGAGIGGSVITPGGATHHFSKVVTPQSVFVATANNKVATATGNVVITTSQRQVRNVTAPINAGSVSIPMATKVYSQQAQAQQTGQQASSSTAELAEAQPQPIGFMTTAGPRLQLPVISVGGAPGVALQQQAGATGPGPATAATVVLTSGPSPDSTRSGAAAAGIPSYTMPAGAYLTYETTYHPTYHLQTTGGQGVHLTTTATIPHVRATSAPRAATFGVPRPLMVTVDTKMHHAAAAAAAGAPTPAGVISVTTSTGGQKATQPLTTALPPLSVTPIPPSSVAAAVHNSVVTSSPANAITAGSGLSSTSITLTSNASIETPGGVTVTPVEVPVSIATASGPGGRVISGVTNVSVNSVGGNATGGNSGCPLDTIIAAPIGGASNGTAKLTPDHSAKLASITEKVITQALGTTPSAQLPIATLSLPTQAAVAGLPSSTTVSIASVAQHNLQSQQQNSSGGSVVSPHSCSGVASVVAPVSSNVTPLGVAVTGSTTGASPANSCSGSSPNRPSILRKRPIGTSSSDIHSLQQPTPQQQQHVSSSLGSTIGSGTAICQPTGISLKREQLAAKENILMGNAATSAMLVVKQEQFEDNNNTCGPGQPSAVTAATLSSAAALTLGGNQHHQVTITSLPPSVPTSSQSTVLQHHPHHLSHHSSHSKGGSGAVIHSQQQQQQQQHQPSSAGLVVTGNNGGATAICNSQNGQLIVSGSGIPRKKPRKQLLQQQQQQQVLPHQPMIENENTATLSVAIKREENGSRNDVYGTAMLGPAQPNKASEAASIAPATALNSIQQHRPHMFYGHLQPNWKARLNHFVRHSDVRSKDADRKLTVNELANQRSAAQRAHGWKLYHVKGQVDEVETIESDAFQRFKKILQEFENSTHVIESGQVRISQEDEKMLTKISDLIKGNLQRSKIMHEQVGELKKQLFKVLDYKPRILDVIGKHVSKRPLKKREKL